MRAPWTLLLLSTLACGDEANDAPLSARIDFAARVGSAPARCGAALPSGPAEVADARLYVSNVELRGEDGAWVPLTLDADGRWQADGVALLDFEDGTGPCADSGTPEQNGAVTGTLPPGRYDGLRFDVGVPFALNHLDSATAQAPLNAPGMFWAWRSGYKFVRVDWRVTSPSPAVPRWNVHLGATGCVSDAPTLPPSTPCARSNRPRVELTSFQLGQTVDLDLARLVTEVDLGVNVPNSPPGCMSAPNEKSDCEPVFDALGLDFDSGASRGTSPIFGTR